MEPCDYLSSIATPFFSSSLLLTLWIEADTLVFMSNRSNFHPLSCCLQSELGPDRAQALRLSSLKPMTDVDPSSGTGNPPRRRSTYKDALELVTAASMRRVKAELRIRGDMVTLDWLDRFSSRELEQRGNALLESLFAGPMVLIKDPLRDRPKVVEPLKVAQEIMQGREVVAEELITVLKGVPQDHLAMTVSLLNEKWESTGDPESGEPDFRES
ncbi:unnamed protein product [Ectocarpus sp. 13 AM-2016]